MTEERVTRTRRSVMDEFLQVVDFVTLELAQFIFTTAHESVNERDQSFVLYFAALAQECNRQSPDTL